MYVFLYNEDEGQKRETGSNDGVVQEPFDTGIEKKICLYVHGKRGCMIREDSWRRICSAEMGIQVQ